MILTTYHLRTGEPRYWCGSYWGKRRELAVLVSGGVRWPKRYAVPVMVDAGQ